MPDPIPAVVLARLAVDRREQGRPDRDERGVLLRDTALLEPLVTGHADVVFGSRFSGGECHRVLYFWHSLGNKFLTLMSNMFTNLNLTDVECCYKVFRREVLKDIRIEEDLLDQLFNSSEKRLARALLLLARYGKQPKPIRVVPVVLVVIVMPSTCAPAGASDARSAPSARHGRAWPPTSGVGLP